MEPKPKIGDWLLLKPTEAVFIKEMIPKLTQIIHIDSTLNSDVRFVDVQVKAGIEARQGQNRSMNRFIHLGANPSKLEKAFYGL